MTKKELKERLSGATSLEEVEALLKDQPELNAEQVWEEVQRHASSKSEKLDLGELDAVSGGGSDRDWTKDGCAATCEPNSWCSSNDWCVYWDVTYAHFWATCPDGSEHQWDSGAGYVCVKCGYNREL